MSHFAEAIFSFSWILKHISVYRTLKSTDVPEVGNDKGTIPIRAKILVNTNS